MTSLQDDTQRARDGADESPRRPLRVFSRSHARTGVLAALGACCAAAYAYFVGCETGTCPITSSVWTASLYGAFVGAVAGWPGRAR